MKKICSFTSIIFLYTALVIAQPGALDGDFDADGILTMNLVDSIDAMYDMTIQPDGKIILVGATFLSAPQYYNASMIRIFPDGSIDPGFGTNGKVFTSLSKLQIVLLQLYLRIYFKNVSFFQ